MRKCFMWLWRLRSSIIYLQTENPGEVVAHSSVTGRGTPSGAKSGLLFNTQKWIGPGDTNADEGKYFIGKGPLGEEQWGKQHKRKKKISVLLTRVSKAYSELITDQPSRSGVYYYFLIGFFFFKTLNFLFCRGL